MSTQTDIIDTLQERIKTYQEDLKNNETMTRYALIDPLLREMGWDLSDPGQVRLENKTTDKSNPDYVVGKNIMVIEAKRIDENLDAKYVKQLIKYANDNNARYGVLTNGREWKIYDACNTKKIPIIEFDITAAKKDVMASAMRLHRDNILDESNKNSK